MSFTDATISTYTNPSFVGLDNYYESLISPGLFWSSATKTVIYIVIAVTGEFVLGLLLALLVRSVKKGAKVLTSLFVLPMLCAPILAAAIFKMMIHSTAGVIPYYVKSFGLPYFSYSDPLHVLTVAALVDIWQWSSFVFIILYAGIVALPVEPFEAAKIDGASRWQLFRHITWPMLRPVAIIAIVFRVFDALRSFEIPWVIFRGGPGAPVGGCTIFSIFVYRMFWLYNEMGIGAASSVIMLTIISIIVSQLMKRLWK